MKWEGFQDCTQNYHKSFFHIFKSVSYPDFPWTGIIFGAPILGIWYWCTDQFIVQRVLSAKNINNARSGAIFAGFLKILPVFILVLPGMIALALFPEIKEEVFELFVNIRGGLEEFQDLLNDTISDKNRKNILDRLGQARSNHRLKIYTDGLSDVRKPVTVGDLISFFEIVLKYIDHSIKANARNDGLYHAYNVIKIVDENTISIRHLYEMLEGQVAVLSSGFLSFEDSIILLNSLKKSKLFQKDQFSYLLYPDRQLTRFTEKNSIPKELFESSRLLKALVENQDRSVVILDINGNAHFNSSLRNVRVLQQALNNLKENKYQLLVRNEGQRILDIYESVFDHQSFTGRSSTFYKYEGLGCIYWHMVSKLLLAVQDTYYRAVEKGAHESILAKIKAYYYEIREEIGVHKNPELYGTFPTDPYSHTPTHSGVQQPGMTGQVKEDIISRFGELGVIIRDSEIHFNPDLLIEDEFLTKSKVFRYFDLNGMQQSLMINPGMFAFTICQVPVIYIIANEQKIIIVKNDGSEEEIDRLVLCSSLSKAIFQREDKIAIIQILISK